MKYLLNYPILTQKECVEIIKNNEVGLLKDNCIFLVSNFPQFFFNEHTETLKECIEGIENDTIEPFEFYNYIVTTLKEKDKILTKSQKLYLESKCNALIDNIINVECLIENFDNIPKNAQYICTDFDGIVNSRDAIIDIYEDEFITTLYYAVVRYID